jgi:hypothetical protein
MTIDDAAADRGWKKRTDGYWWRWLEHSDVVEAADMVVTPFGPARVVWEEDAARCVRAFLGGALRCLNPARNQDAWLALPANNPRSPKHDRR